ncbi:MAG: FkbM family methyltransferase, partial [Methylococcaceae bacterium]|nr:FkbM family methyltransferase [Methylococcaceae bacterium]
PDFLSLDVEGLDLKILQSFNFVKWRPKVICVETITYSEKCDGKKIKDIEILLIEKGYFSYADTHINTIFVDKAIW